MIYWQVGCITASWMWCFSAAHCSEQMQREVTLHRETSRSRHGAVLATSSKWMKAKVFKKKIARVVSMYLLWKKACQKGLEAAKYSAKVALITRGVTETEGGWYWGRPTQVKSMCGKHWAICLIHFVNKSYNIGLCEFAIVLFYGWCVLINRLIMNPKLRSF